MGDEAFAATSHDDDLLKRVERSTFMNDESRQTRRDIRRALIFGVVAATLEMAVLWYFLR